MNTTKSNPDDELSFESDQHIKKCFEKDGKSPFYSLLLLNLL